MDSAAQVGDSGDVFIRAGFAEKLAETVAYTSGTDLARDFYRGGSGGRGGVQLTFGEVGTSKAYLVEGATTRP